MNKGQVLGDITGGFRGVASRTGPGGHRDTGVPDGKPSLDFLPAGGAGGHARQAWENIEISYII